MQFSIDLKTMPVTNQKSSGRCWIFAGLNVLREIVAKKCQIAQFELSQNYIAFYDKYEKINYFLECMIELKDCNPDDRTFKHIVSTGVQDGGQWDMFVSLIKKYGVVPKQAMDETYASSNTRDTNFLINTKLRQAAYTIQTMAKNNASDEAIYQYKDQVLNELYGLLCTVNGVPPQTFDFEYVDEKGVYHLEQHLTPKSFNDTYIGDCLDDYISIINAPTADKPFNRIFTVSYLGNVIEGNPITYLNVEMDIFKQLVLKQLSDGEVVWFGSDCGKFSSRDEGVFDDSAFKYDDTFGIDFSLSKGAMLTYGHSMMNHAMVLTGVNLVDGKNTKWKIQNSWGDGAGKKVYFVCSDTWFDRFVYQAVVNKKYLSDNLKDALKGQPIVLKPWDPMGSLAD